MQEGLKAKKQTGVRIMHRAMMDYHFSTHFLINFGVTRYYVHFEVHWDFLCHFKLDPPVNPLYSFCLWLKLCFIRNWVKDSFYFARSDILLKLRLHDYISCSFTEVLTSVTEYLKRGYNTTYSIFCPPLDHQSRKVRGSHLIS